MQKGILGRLGRLPELARNLFSTWRPEARKLFRRLASKLWERLMFSIALFGAALSIIAIVIAVVLFGAALGTVEVPAAELLPDIDPRAPKELQVRPDESGGFQLSFDAAFDNVGAGPLHIDGRRLDTPGHMVADQVIHQPYGLMRRNPDVGELLFTESEDHRHWHFFQFMRYELVRPANGELVAPDQKTGFCLGDRYNTDPDVRLPGEPTMPGAFDVPPSHDWCARNDPDRSRLTMGLSVGYGDNYRAFLDGQSIDITDVPEGRYHLVHRVNASVLESDYSNNAASVLLELRWPDDSDDPPTVTVLASCADTAGCPPEQPPQ